VCQTFLLSIAAVLQVHVRVSIPKQMSGDERKLVEQLKELQSKTRVGPFTF
jgi:molecular chaperone DnaJ